MRILYGKRLKFLLQTLASTQAQLRKTKEEKAELLAELKTERSVNGKLAEEIKQFTSPAYRAKIRREVEHDRLSAAQEELKKQMPKELADKVDWKAVDWL